MLDKEELIEIGADGILREPLRLSDRGEGFVIDIDEGTRVTGPYNMQLSRIELTITKEVFVVPDDMVILSPVYRLIGYTKNMRPTQIHFNPPARLTMRYDPADLPENTFPPFIAQYTDDDYLVWLPTPPDAPVEIGKAKAEIRVASLFAVVAQLAPTPPPLPATFEVSNLIIEPRQAQLGQPVTVSLTIANEGALVGDYELYLIIDGIVRAVKEITLAGKSTETVTFEVSNLAAGKHQVKIADLTGQFTVEMTVTSPGEARVNWLLVDLSIGAALIIGALWLYVFARRSRQTQLE